MPRAALADRRPAFLVATMSSVSGICMAGVWRHAVHLDVYKDTHGCLTGARRNAITRQSIEFRYAFATPHHHRACFSAKRDVTPPRRRHLGCLMHNRSMVT